VQRPHNHQLLPLLLLAGAVFAACGDEPLGTEPESGPQSQREGALPPTARPDTVEHFRADLAAVRHPSDGGGSVELVLADGDDGSVVAGGRRSWTFQFTVGPEGISDGGALYFQTSPFWGWSTPQVIRPREAGFMSIELIDRSVSDVISLEGQTLGPNLIAIMVTGRALSEGEEIELVFGANGALARADRHAEEGETFWFAVDGDGDGVRELLKECPRVDVHAGAPSLLVLTLTSVTRPLERPRLTAAILDVTGSTGLEVEGSLSLRLESSTGLEGPSLSVDFNAADKGRKTIELDPLPPGVWRASGEISLDEETFSSISNPLLCDDKARRVRWGDLHGHSQLTDGTGTPDDFYTYARDVAMLDFCALTDHDHWGMRFVDAHEDVWLGLQATTNAHNAPGDFVTLVGYEWTSWIHGHRHVLSFNDSIPMHSSVDEETNDPAELWAALRGTDSLTMAHHSAGGPIATNWDFPPDPVLEPLTEVMSVHGSSEAMDSPSLIYSPLRGNFVRDALDKGYELGFIASGDGHDGHPGLPHVSPFYGYRGETSAGPARVGTGGLAAVYSEELTRTALLKELRARSTYATSGPRLLLYATLEDQSMGSRVKPRPGEAALSLELHGQAPIEELELIRSGAVISRLKLPEPALDLEHSFRLKDLGEGEYVYLRIRQSDGGLAWSSPWFITGNESGLWHDSAQEER
jgi:hypothetical protein